MELELTAQEMEAVHHALQVYLEQLREEIVKTDRREWKAKLHQEKDLLKQVVGKLCQTSVC